MRAAWSRRVCTRIVVSAVFVAIVLSIAAEVIRQARETALESSCARHLAILRSAIQSYHQTYGCYPPAYVAGRDGSPAHSWRVLLLPFLGRQDLYEQYRFDEPWNGPNNSRLASLDWEKALFNCPADPSSWANGYTNYVVIRGPGTIFDGAKSVSQSDIRDSLVGTVLLVETTAINIKWTEPRDLDLERMDFAVGKPTGNNISSMHPRGARVLTAAGYTLVLSPTTTERDIRAIASIAGGEDVDWTRISPSN